MRYWAEPDERWDAGGERLLIRPIRPAVAASTMLSSTASRLRISGCVSSLPCANSHPRSSISLPGSTTTATWPSSPYGRKPARDRGGRTARPRRRSARGRVCRYRAARPAGQRARHAPDVAPPRLGAAARRARGRGRGSGGECGDDRSRRASRVAPASPARVSPNHRGTVSLAPLPPRSLANDPIVG